MSTPTNAEDGSGPVRVLLSGFVGCAYVLVLLVAIIGAVVFYQDFVVPLRRDGWTDSSASGLLLILSVVWPLAMIAGMLPFLERRRKTDSVPLDGGVIAPLVPVESRWNRFGPPFVLAMFLNLFVWSGVLLVVVGLLTDGPRPLFVFLALGLTGAAIAAGSFLQGIWRELRNPEPVVTLGRTPLPVGDTVPVEWRFRGRAKCLTGLRIAFCGYEKATGEILERGRKRERTEERLFARHEVFETSDPAVATSGLTEITVPEGIVPSFRAGSKGISWNLELSAQTRRLPAVEERYEVEVVPRDDDGGAR